ncbi:hypothetical protein BJV74DRAFT_323611 [Russula compacta]|nr:hypothetical protein BJV74DRAFT_323611 [Russula compacta]
MLRNPFGRDTVVSDGVLAEGEDELEVDLASWGLDPFIPKEKGGSKRKSKGKEKVMALPNPHATTQASSYRSTRSLSVGNIDSFGTGGAFLDSVSTAAPDGRRRTVGSAQELGDYGYYRPPPRQRPLSTHDVIDRIPPAPPLHSIPFPTQSIRSVSPGPNDGLIRHSHDRAQSLGSMGSKDLLAEAEEKPNPFALDPPSPGHTSRFDPKARSRAMSVGTMGSAGSRNIFAEDAPLRSQSPSSRLDPTHTRTLSNASMLRDHDGTSFLSGIPSRRQIIRDRPYSTLELMRPKVLVMPSPLQAQGSVVVPQALEREGFEITTDGPPLPHGARSNSSGGLLGNASGSAVPIASNSFTPNPRASLTLSQLTFRNTLMVGGQRDVSYADIDSGLRRATEEGEQIIDEVPEEVPARPVTVIVDEPESAGRAPGKLYGRSLVDELEHRKAVMRSKQRVFTGDDRPSMMARGPTQRTLIDPTSLNQLPVSQNALTKSETSPNIVRRGSLGGKPLLNFDEDRSPGVHTSRDGGPSAPRSVFGVDTLWVREMAKLKEIEAREAEEQRKQEVAEAQKKSKKKNKGKEKAIPPEVPVEEPRVPAGAPALPVIQRSITRGPPPPPDDDGTESSSELSDVDVPRPPPQGASAEGWHSGESDKEMEGPVRTTGVGPRYPNRTRGRHPAAETDTQLVDGDDSEEDMPLADTVSRAVQRATRLGFPATEQSDSDEEKPLSQLLTKSKYTEPSLYGTDKAVSATPNYVDGGKNEGEEEDEDDNKPLGLRVSRFISSQSQFGNGDAEDDDDRPLAFHPEQQRRTQYNMFVQQQQQQQQQQQLLLQAQMQQSMMFSHQPLMGPGFFGGPVIPPPPPMMPMMPQPAPASPPPGAQDISKFGRVDRWRREIVGGQP